MLVKKFFEIVTPLLSKGDMYKIQISSENALKTLFNASDCHFRVLIRDKEKPDPRNIDNTQYLKHMEYLDKHSKHCDDEDLLPIVNTTHIYYKRCKNYAINHKLLRLRIFSSPTQEFNKLTHNVYATICLLIEESDDEYAYEELYNLERTLSFYYFHKIIAYYHELWHKIRSKIRENSETTISEVYNTCLDSFRRINIPIKYSCIFTYAKAKEMNCRQDARSRHYLIKQKCLLYGENLSKNEKNIDLGKNTVIEFYSNKYKHGFVSKIAEKWLNKYCTNNEFKDYDYLIEKKKNVVLLNSALNDLDFSHVVAFPIISTDKVYLKREEPAFKGLVLLFLSPTFPDFTFFFTENLKLYIISLIRAINIANLYTNKAIVSDEINKNSSTFTTNENGFCHKLYSAFIKKAFLLQSFEIWRLTKDRKAEFLYKFETKEIKLPKLHTNSVLNQDNLQERIRLLKLNKNLYYSYFEKNKASLLISYIKGQSTKGIVVCKNRLSYTNNNRITPFNSEEIELLTDVGNKILFVYDSKKEERKVIEMARVVHHETANAIFSLQETLKEVSNEIPSPFNTYKSIDLLFNDIHESFQLLSNINNWPKILSGNYRINPTEVPVLSMYYKWKNLYRYRIRAKNLIVKIPPLSSENDIAFYKNRPKLMADKELLDHSISNLLSNAIKYSYEGTIISMDSCLEGEKHLLKIKNIGIGIHEDEYSDIFELFYRSKNAKRSTSDGEGTGAGLFIVKMCIVNHNWNFIRPVSTKLSDYCLPIIFWLERKKCWSMIDDNKIIDKAKNEYLNKYDIFNKYYNVAYDKVILNPFVNSAIKKATYLTEFKIYS